MRAHVGENRVYGKFAEEWEKRLDDGPESRAGACFALANAVKCASKKMFQGQWEDAETGLHYNRFRYYDPDLARYISQDPIGLEGGGNLYSYVLNPTGWVDPRGLSPCKDPSREQILAEASRIIKSYEPQIKQLDPNASLGIRGSVATGVRSSGGPFNPKKYDVDAFVISDKWKIPKTATYGQDVGLGGIEQSIKRDMQKSPCLKGRTKGRGKFDFKIFGTNAVPGLRREGAVFL